MCVSVCLLEWVDARVRVLLSFLNIYNLFLQKAMACIVVFISCMVHEYEFVCFV